MPASKLGHETQDDAAERDIQQSVTRSVIPQKKRRRD